MRLLRTCRVASLLLLGAAAACSAPPPDTPPASTEARPAPVDVSGADPESRVFTLLNEEGDTVSIDAYTRTAEALEGEIRVHLPGAKFQRARYLVEYDSEGRAVHARLTFLRSSTPTGEPALGQATAVVHPDGVVEETRDEGSAVLYRTGVGVVPWFPPSTAMMQEIIRRAHRLTGGRGSVEVPHFPLASGGQGIGTATIGFSAPDSVEISYGPGSGSLRLAVDRQGRLLGGRTGEGQVLAVDPAPDRLP